VPRVSIISWSLNVKDKWQQLLGSKSLPGVVVGNQPVARLNLQTQTNISLYFFVSTG